MLTLTLMLMLMLMLCWFFGRSGGLYGAFMWRGVGVQEADSDVREVGRFGLVLTTLNRSKAAMRH
jgi:hypothetical protein